MQIRKTLKLLFNEVWFVGWTVFTIFSFFLAMVGGYGYIILLGLFIGISQTISLGWIDKSKYSGLWLINAVIWVYITYSYSGNENYDQILWLLPILLLPLNEVILWAIFRRFSNFIWSGINLIAYGYIYLIFEGANFLISLELQYNDAMQFILFIIAFVPYSLLSGYSIHLAYKNVRHTIEVARGG